METAVVVDVLGADVNSLQNGDAKEFKGALESTLEDFGGKLEDFKVTKGTVTIVVDSTDACDKLLEELKSQGMDARKKRPLAAFKDRLALKHSIDEKAGK